MIISAVSLVAILINIIQFNIKMYSLVNKEEVKLIYNQLDLIYKKIADISNEIQFTKNEFRKHYYESKKS